MKTTLRFSLTMLLCLIVCLFVAPAAFAETVASGTWGNLTWELSAEGILTISGSGKMEDPKITGDQNLNRFYPWYNYKDSINKIIINSGVTSVSQFAFSECSVREVILPDSLQIISRYAFHHCFYLTDLNIPKNVQKIGYFAFIGTAIPSFHIPSSLAIIQDGAFCSNKLNKDSFSIDSNNTHFVVDENGILYDKSHSGENWYGENDYRQYSNRYTLLNCPHNSVNGLFVIDSKVTQIAAYALRGVESNAVEIPESVLGIGNFTFGGGNIKEIYFKGSPLDIPPNAFSNLTATAYYPTNKGWTEDNLQNYGGNLTWIPFDPSGDVPDFILPNSLTEIHEEAFVGGAFHFVQLPEGTVSIGKRAFADCPNLSSIYIPAATTEIDPTAFENVSNLTIYGKEGSYAEFFAWKNGYSFVVK